MAKKLSVIVVSITPFDQAGALDERALRQHLGRLRDAGVSAFIGGSGSGEGYTLTPEETDRLLAIAVEELKGKVGVFADAVEPRTAKEMVNYMRRVEHSKVDAVRIMPLDMGHGSKPTVAELERYHSTVIDSTSNPIILTSHQSAGYILPFELIERLANRYPSIVGINYGGTDTTYLSELIRRMSDRMEVHCAGCLNSVSTLNLGGNGFMGGEGNFMPSLAASIIQSFQANDKVRMQESFRKMMALSALNNRFGAGSMRAMKPLLNAFGLPGGTLREPRLPISAAELDEVVKAVLKLEIPGTPPLAR